MPRWPSVKLVFGANVKHETAQIIIRELKKSFLLKSDNLNRNHRVRGAFRITVQVYPDQEASFRREVTRTEGINLDK